MFILLSTTKTTISRYERPDIGSISCFVLCCHVSSSSFSFMIIISQEQIVGLAAAGWNRHISWFPGGAWEPGKLLWRRGVMIWLVVIPQLEEAKDCHCERSEAISILRGPYQIRDCHVTSFLAMTSWGLPLRQRHPNLSLRAQRSNLYFTRTVPNPRLLRRFAPRNDTMGAVIARA
jgi:hypothetical protein